MPGPDTLLAFLGLSMLLTLAPGPDKLMVLSLSVARGPRAGLSARWRSRPGWSTGLERCAGGIFVALALRLAVGSGPT